jgi:hypothetical protein
MEVDDLDSFKFIGVDESSEADDGDGDDDDDGLDQFYDTFQDDQSTDLDSVPGQLFLSDFCTTDETETSSEHSSSLAVASSISSSPSSGSASVSLGDILQLYRHLSLSSFHFTIENLFDEKEQCKSRYVIQDKMKAYLHLFPWFPHDKRVRYREVISATNSREIAQRIVDAMNYWYEGKGRQLDERSLDIIRLYYEPPDQDTDPQGLSSAYRTPEKDQWLSHIILVTERLELLLSSPFSSSSSSSSFPSSPSPLASSFSTFPEASHDLGRGGGEEEGHAMAMAIERGTESIRGDTELRPKQSLPIPNRIDLHETKLTGIETDIHSLKVRAGGDRAGWLRIRSDDLPTRDRWCIEGGVFGLYADGVGPLVRCDVRRKKSVVVYSTDPDTVEDHPNPSDPDSYVRVVMVCAPLLTSLSVSLSLDVSLSFLSSLFLSRLRSARHQ